MNKLVLIDGNAIIHRAYHALPPLTNKKGEIVNAVYGFFSMFLKILEDQIPDYIVVCFDKAAPTFRQELFVGYQAHRPKISDDLPLQFQFIHEILEKAKICIFEVDGYEADDLIGTLATQAMKFEVRSIKYEVLIVSGDRDLLQLVNSHVKMLAPITGLTNMLIYDSQLVKEKFGIEPSQIVDYKSLIGDESDNYPGVSGIGPKTAVNLLNEFKSLENIYKNLEGIKKKNPKLALKLAEGAESAGLAKKLAKIVTEAPIKLDIKRCTLTNLNIEGLKKEFAIFGFKSLLKRLIGEKKEDANDKKKKAKQMELI